MQHLPLGGRHVWWDALLPADEPIQCAVCARAGKLSFTSSEFTNVAFLVYFHGDEFFCQELGPVSHGDDVKWIFTFHLFD